MPENYRETSQDWQTEIEELGRADPVIQISRLDKPYRSINDGSSLEELFSGLVGLTLDEDPRELLFNSSSGSAFLVGQLACELFLSRYGMTYLSPEARQLPGRASMDIRSSSALMPEDMLIDSQESTRSTIRSSSVAFESQASSRASTPASTAHSVTTRASATDETGIGGFDLIRALTGSATMPLQRRSKLPSPWTVGEDSPRTVFTVDNNIEVTDGMRRRAKQEAREARKRKRAETFLQLQQENLLSSTQPSFHANFYTQASQPLNDYSSQPRVVPSAAAIAMSQPVAGAFGGRSDFERPKKKPKRKGGF